LISDVVGDSKKVLHAALLLVAVSFPIGAVFFYLHLDPERWRWVLVSFGVTITTASATQGVKKIGRTIRARRANKAKQSIPRGSHGDPATP
jgi:hypothetical protein